MKSISRLFILLIVTTILVNFAFGQQTVHKLNFDSAKLRVLVLNGKIDSLNRCLKQGVNPNSPNEDGLTLLMIAAAKGYDTIVQTLLKKPVDVNAKTNKDGVTPLMFAVTFGHLSTVKVLIEQGHADISIKDKNSTGKRGALEWSLGRGSFIWALKGSKEEEDAISTAIGKYLVSKGAVVQEFNFVDQIVIFGEFPNLSALLNKIQINK